MIQNNLLKTFLCLWLLPYSLHCSQLPQPILKTTDNHNSTNSPQSCYIEPVTGKFKKTFSQENLATLRPDQSPEALEPYEARPDYQAIAAHEKLTGKIIAAYLSFLAENNIWLKSFAIDPTASKDDLINALYKITQALRKENPGYPLCCNIKKTDTDPTNVIVHTALTNLGWKPMHHFHKLIKATHPLTDSLSTIELTFASTRTATSLASRQKRQIDAYNTFNTPETLARFDSTRAVIAELLDNPKCTSIIAYIGTTPIGAATYTLPQPNHGKIELLAVISSMRRKGVATSLLKWVQKELSNYHNAQTVEINVLESNGEALCCYQKNGFEISSTMAKLRKSANASPTPEFQLSSATIATHE